MNPYRTRPEYFATDVPLTKRNPTVAEKVFQRVARDIFVVAPLTGET
jgi:hypothetical protein